MAVCNATKLPSKSLDLIGLSFGILTVIEYAGHAKSSPHSLYYKCRCACGVEKLIRGGHLRAGKIVSCGCYARELRSLGISGNQTTHGKYKSLTYSSWKSMISRCCNPNHDSWPKYGGAGIAVCQEWIDSFEAFLLDMGERPSIKHSLDRFPDQRGDYVPWNCRWATSREQARNRSTNRLLHFQGRSLTISEWSEILGIARNTISIRLNRLGYSVEEALTKPADRQRRLH